MSTIRPTARPPRPRLYALPAPGDRVCLAGLTEYADRHDHGTVADVRPSARGPLVLVTWDDEGAAEDAASWANVEALDARCPTRHDRTPCTAPAAGWRS